MARTSKRMKYFFKKLPLDNLLTTDLLLAHIEILKKQLRNANEIRLLSSDSKLRNVKLNIFDKLVSGSLM